MSEPRREVPFAFRMRVYYEDTDAGGVVYYADYLKFMERARTEWLEALGFLVTLACVDTAHWRPTRIPKPLREALESTG